MNIKGNIIDILHKKIYFGELILEGSKILAINRLNKEDPEKNYILPGFIDAHVHIESSMLMPSEFARLAIRHGTIGVVTDPHEIANVLGIPGIEYFIENSKKVPFHFCFGAPSCVPATTFETAGATINSAETRILLENPDIRYLSEMMNYPGVLFKDAEVMAKIQHAKELNMPIDGHAPGLKGQNALDYMNAGISTDHECFTYEESLFKIQNGMKILIREGSAAKNFEALYPLIDQYPDKVMLCSDDKHPDDLELGHINLLIKRALGKGVNLFNVLKAACINPIEHYNLDLGQLREGDSADFIIVKNKNDFAHVQTFLKGNCVAENGKELFESVPIEPVNNFKIDFKEVVEFEFSAQNKIPKEAIVAIDGEIVTQRILVDNPENFQKIAVVNRYSNEPIKIGLIEGFELKQGALASSVAHDSHNIVVVGNSAEDMSKAVNLIIEYRGGVCAVSGSDQSFLPLPIAGIVSDKKAEEVAKGYAEVDTFSKDILGCTLSAPFMTLSFMALLVIPSLKMSDKGLFDGEAFKFVED